MTYPQGTNARLIEVAEYQTDQLLQAQAEADKVAKATAKANLLAKLGITEDEAKLLLA